jgi:membrane fusion protein
MFPKLTHVGLSLLSCFIAFASLYYISSQPFFETVNVKGWVNTKTPNINVRSNEASGIVQKLFVNNGSQVQVGETIAIISRSKGNVLGKDGILAQQGLILQEQSNKLTLLQHSKANLALESKAIAQRYARTAEQLAQIDKHQKKHKHQLKIAKKRWESVKALLGRGLVSLVQLEQSEVQMLSLHQQDFDLFMRSQTIQSTYNDLREQLFANKQQQQQIEYEIDLLNTQTQQQLDAFINDTQMNVSAPSSGIIDNLQIDVGKGIAFNQVIAQIAPLETDYFVQLAIPSHQVAFLQKDQEVQIKVEGFAYQRFGSLRGVVRHISEHLIAPQDIDGHVVNADQGLYLVDIDIDYNTPASTADDIILRSGMAISATVKKQETTILDWLMGPLLDIVKPAFAPENVSSMASI